MTFLRIELELAGRRCKSDSWTTGRQGMVLTVVWCRSRRGIGSVYSATRRCSVCWSYEERRQLEEQERKLQEDEARRIQQVAREPEEQGETEIEEERELVRS